MYGDIMDISKRVQFIFPNKINLYSPEYKGAHFHTFVNEVDGFQSFYHVLTFYEELNFLQAESDFDCNTAMFAEEFEQAQRIEAELKEQTSKGPSEDGSSGKPKHRDKTSVMLAANKINERKRIEKPNSRNRKGSSISKSFIQAKSANIPLPRHKRKQRVPIDSYNPITTETDEYDDKALQDEEEDIYKAPDNLNENLPAVRDKSQIKVPFALANSDIAFKQVLEEHSRSNIAHKYGHRQFLNEIKAETKKTRRDLSLIFDSQNSNETTKTAKPGSKKTDLFNKV